MESRYIGAGHLDRFRAQALMRAENLDALLLMMPESIVYATGADPGSATKPRRIGSAFVLVPADPTRPPAAVVGDFYADGFHRSSTIQELRTVPIWVDTADISAVSEDLPIERKLKQTGAVSKALRPSTFDRGAGFDALKAMLAAHSFAHARIGVELGLVSHDDAVALFRDCPHVQWVDATYIMGQLRSVKSTGEIARLSNAARASEVGVRAVVAALHPGMRAQEMRMIYESETLSQARSLNPEARVETWASITVGPAGWGDGSQLATGDLLKIDAGCVIDGYSSDSARTFAFGHASVDAMRLFNAMRHAHEAAVAALRPGACLCDIYAAALHHMHAVGFDTYRRGHFGHSLGATLFVEEWPFIDGAETSRVEPNMVLAIEVPWYIKGVGALMIEDQFVISQDHVEPLWTLNRELVLV